MGEELDRLFAWLRDHPEWSAEITHKPSPRGLAFLVEVKLIRGEISIGSIEMYRPEELRLMKASMWTLVDSLIDAAGRAVSNG